jgi:hypothetical protein
MILSSKGLAYVPIVIIMFLFLAILGGKFLVGHFMFAAQGDSSQISLVGAKGRRDDRRNPNKVHQEDPLECTDAAALNSKHVEIEGIKSTLDGFKTKEEPCADNMCSDGIVTSEPGGDPVVDSVAEANSIHYKEISMESSSNGVHIAENNQSEHDFNVVGEVDSMSIEDPNFSSVNNGVLEMSAIPISIPNKDDFNNGEDALRIGSAEESKEREDGVVCGESTGSGEPSDDSSSSLHDAESISDAPLEEQEQHDAASTFISMISTDISEPACPDSLPDAISALMRDDELDVVAALK